MSTLNGHFDKEFNDLMAKIKQDLRQDARLFDAKATAIMEVLRRELQLSQQQQVPPRATVTRDQSVKVVSADDASHSLDLLIKSELAEDIETTPVAVAVHGRLGKR